MRSDVPMTTSQGNAPSPPLLGEWVETLTNEAKWTPAVGLGERLFWMVLLGCLPWAGVASKGDLFSLVFAILWSGLLVSVCVWRIIADTRDGADWGAQ